MKFKLLFAFLLASITLSSQSTLLRNNNNLLGFELGFDGKEELNYITGGLRYVMKGKTEVSISYGIGSAPDSGDLSLGRISLGAFQQLIKGDFNLGAGLGYSFLNIASDEFDVLGISLSGTELKAYTDIGYNFGSSSDIIPYTTIIYRSEKLTASDGTDEASETENTVGLGLGIQLGINVGSNIVLLNPQIVLSDEDIYFSLRFAYFLNK